MEAVEKDGGRMKSLATIIRDAEDAALQWMNGATPLEKLAMGRLLQLFDSRQRLPLGELEQAIRREAIKIMRDNSSMPTLRRMVGK